MTDKELRHLNRSELLQMLITQGEENRRLKEELEETKKKLNERQLVMDNAGSIAEASLQLSGIFEAAEQAAKQYLESVKGNAIGTVETAVESPVSASTAPPCVKTKDMTSDDYWQQVKKRAQLILGGQE